jgi:hypothetical protein
MLNIVLLVLLIIGFVSLWAHPKGRALFDVTVFIVLLLLLLSGSGVLHIS